MKDTDVERRFDDIDPWLDQIDQRFNEMRELIIAEGERTRRHIDVFAERLEGKVNLITEGHSALRDDGAELKSRLESVENGQGRLDLHVLAIESRVTSIEKTQKIALTEVRGLATKIDRLTRARNRPTRM